jgi:signal transduction histidine kinase
VPLTNIKIRGAVHAADFAWAAALTLRTGGAASPFFVLFLFSVLSAAFRWRLRATLITGAAAVGVMLVHAISVGGGPPGGPRVTADLLALRGMYIAVAAALVGLLAESEKGRREQAASIADLLVGVQSQRGFRAALKYLSGALMTLTRSDVLLIAARELDSERVVRWTSARARSGAILLNSTDLPEDLARLYFFHADGDGWSIERCRADACKVTAVDRDGVLVGETRCDLEPRFWQFHPHGAALVVSIGFGGAWRGRVYLLRAKRFTLGELRFVHRALCQLVPAVHNQYLVRRLRSRAGAAERRRVARELHHGVIRSLIGLETETAALRRDVGSRDPALEQRLQRMERLLGEKAQTVRDVIHKIQPADVGPGQFVPALTEMVERFGRETGVAATLYAGPHDHYVPARAARDLASTLQEALANVRRHSGARRVDVEFRSDAQAWRLDVENDGRPLGFVGRLSLDELEARRLGPRLIKERVRDMGGDLVIESSATAGVRLEISLARAEEQSRIA